MCPIWKDFNFWNHLLNNEKFLLHQHNAESDHLLVYRIHIWSLLNCVLYEKFNNLERQLKDTWTTTFCDYYETHLKNSIFKRSGRWLFEKASIYSKSIGATINPAESFNV